MAVKGEEICRTKYWKVPQLRLAEADADLKRDARHCHGVYITTCINQWYRVLDMCVAIPFLETGD